MEYVTEANKSPYNIRNGVSSPHTLYFSGDHYEINMGSNVFIHLFTCNPTLIPLSIKGLPVIKIRKSDNHLLLSLKIHDTSGTELVRIEDNELQYSMNPWDIEYLGSTSGSPKLKIRGGPRRLLTEIEFHPPRGIKISRGVFAHDGTAISVHPTYILDETLKNQISGCFQVTDAKASIEIGSADHHFTGSAIALRVP